MDNFTSVLTQNPEELSLKERFLAASPTLLRGIIRIGLSATEIIADRDFESIRKYLTEHPIEGIVFWKDGEPKCKIKRTDFGLEWPVRKD